MNRFHLKAVTILLPLLFLFTKAEAQSPYNAYYYQKASLFEKLPVGKKDIVFLGNSITDGGEWFEIFSNPRIKNRGISADIAQGVFDRLGSITSGKPAKIFLLIGINDVSHNVTADSIVRAIAKIATAVERESPHTRLYIQSVFPVNEDFCKYLGATQRGNVVLDINKGLRELCAERGLTYVDVYSALKEKNSEKLDPRYTNDGLHLMGDGYFIWKSVLKRYIDEK